VYYTVWRFNKITIIGTRQFMTRVGQGGTIHGPVFYRYVLG